MTLLIHVGNLLVHVGANLGNLLVQALHCALQLHCVVVLRLCQTAAVFLCFRSRLPRRATHTFFLSMVTRTRQPLPC